MFLFGTGQRASAFSGSKGVNRGCSILDNVYKKGDLSGGVGKHLDTSMGFLSFDLADLSTKACIVEEPPASAVRICRGSPGYRDDRQTRYVDGNTLLQFCSRPRTGAFDTISLYCVETGKVRVISLSPPLAWDEMHWSRLLGTTLVIPDCSGSRHTFATARCIDLWTGDVRTVRLGIFEQFEKNVYVSADEKRIVAWGKTFGTVGDDGKLGEIAVYTLL